MRKFIVAACAVTLAAVWTVAPAIAQDKDKTESKTEQLKDKAVETKDKIKEKAVEAKDKIKEKAVEAKDKIKEKTSGTKDKAEDKADRAKDKAETKGERLKDKLAAKVERADVKSAQKALKDKGFDPGPIDGIHGPRTSAAVRDFQKAENITVTGQLDDATMAKLQVRTGGTDSTSPSATPATDATQPSATGAPAPAKRQNP
jgi:peptidoglycan hydrolase-like protein with peptidoglycan-binding domain